MMKNKKQDKYKYGIVGAIILWLSLIVLGTGYYNFWYLTLWQNTFGLEAAAYSPILLTLLFGFGIGMGVYYLMGKK
jgi:hypothetical protein